MRQKILAPRFVAFDTKKLYLDEVKRLSVSAKGGFTRVELIVVVAIVVLLLTMLIPALIRARQKAQRIDCVSNLKCLGTAERLWANDHSDLAPWEASVTNGGWKEIVLRGNAGPYCWTNYAIVRNELGGSPQIVVCPTDQREAATNFIVKGTTNDTGNAAFKDNTVVSYLVGVSADDANQCIAGGDRNLGPGLTPDAGYGWSPTNGNGNDVIIQTASPVTFSLKMHSAGQNATCGNIMLGDGSSQQASSSFFRSNWLAKAQAGTKFLGTNQSGIRLVFP